MWCGLAVPLSPIVTFGLVDEVLEIASCPVELPITVGLNVRVRLIACPGLSFAGRLTDEEEKPAPETEIELMVTAAVPLDVRVTVCVVELFTTIAPNAIELALTLRAGVAAFSWRTTDFDVLPVEAISVADCAVVTAATLAVNVAELAVPGTVIELGMLTELLLLLRATDNPPDGAEPESVTVQVSESEPVTEVLPQERAFTLGAAVVPVPLRLTVAGEALLAMLSWPVNELAVVG